MSNKKIRKTAKNNISRREFLRSAGLVVGGAALGSTAFLSACESVTNIFKTTTTGVTYFPAVGPASVSILPKPSIPVNTILPATVIPGTVSPLLLSLSLWASNSPTKPADAFSGYPIKDRMFIDWNAGNQTRWFQWNLAINKAAKVLWQVSMMPYSNSQKTIMNPPGLVSSGVIPGTQQEFSINTSKFTPVPSAIRDNFAGPVFYTTAQQNVNLSSISRVRTIAPSARGVSTFNSAIATKIANTNTLYAREKELLSGYSSSLPTLSTGLTSASDKVVIVSDPIMAATKAILEATTFATMRTYYVRVITLDSSDKPFGSPSNSIQISYGDPIFETDVSVLKQMVMVQAYGTGDFQYRVAYNLDWNSGAANLNKKYIAPLADTKNYAYTYFQVTQEQVEPDKAYAMYPDGLVATVLSQQIEVNGIEYWANTKIDFSKFAPPADSKNPAQTRYYVRAVHVYSDYDHIGYAKLAFSPPLVINYGDPKALAIDNSMIIPIDIGTPSIRFASYTPPYFGDNPGDHAIVTKTPMVTWTVLDTTMVVGTPFSSLKPNDKVRISELKAWLEDQRRNEGADILTSIIHAFEVLFTGIADLVTSIGDTWTQIQAYAVSALASIGIPPVIGGLLINAALMAAGIPPTLPNFDTLCEIGTNGISDMIVQQSGGLVPKALADAAAKELVSQAKKAASTTVSGLPGDLSSLNGCLKPDTAFVWKPATISIELYNQLKTQIPSGSFVVRLVESGEYKVTPDTKDFFKPQTINYPPLKGGQKINLTIPLEEACEFVIGSGEKHFLPFNSGPNSYWKDTWDKMIFGHKQLQAVIENKQPNIPSPPEYMQELGTGALLVHFNIIDTVLNIKQGMANIKTAWNSPDNRFPSAIYVSPSGNDSSNGSIYSPVKTLDHALAVSNANDSIVMAPGTYQATNVSITKPFITLAGSAPGAIIKTAANADFAFKVAQSATEFSMRGLEVDGAVYINGPDGVVLNALKVINPKSVGIQLINCNMPLITNCEVGKSGTGTGNIYNGIILDSSYAFVVSNCYVHDIVGNGIQIINTSALGEVKNSTINNCNIGILIGGSGDYIENCFIHDTNLAGVSFKGSSNCSITRCTLRDTMLDALYGYAPLYFDINGAFPNSVFTEKVQNLGTFPQTFYAENCIFSEGADNNCIMLVNASDDHTQLGIAKEQAAYVKSNTYYSKNGLVRYIDLRTNQRYQFTNTGKLPNGITSFNWAGNTGVSFDTGSKELDPKLDSQGRSILPDCLGMGIQ